MITGLLQNKQKQAEQQKQDAMAAYMGEAPAGHGESGNGGLLSGLGGMLQGIGGAKKPHKPGDGGPNADGIAGPNDGKLMSENEVYGSTAGTGSYDLTAPAPEDEIL